MRNKEFEIVGNYVCLDFINTQILENNVKVELLRDFSELLNWYETVGILDAKTAEDILANHGNSNDAEKVYSQAIELREYLGEMAEQILAKKAVAPRVVKKLNAVLNANPKTFEIQINNGKFEKRWQFKTNDLQNLLFPIVDSAADLLCYADFSLVKKCENERCVLYFYDTTKNHNRRWCSMTKCGNRIKAASYYQRKKNIG